MYQLTISGSTLLMAIASVSLLILSVGVTVLLTWRILHASARLLLFENMGALLKYGPLYNTLTEEGTLFFLVNLLVRFLWGLCVAMLSTHAIAQIGVLLAVELGYMLVIGVKWPFTESGDNKFHLLLGFLRIVITGCSIAYLHELDTTPEVRQLFGYIQMALHLAVFIVMFALILWNTIQVVLLWQSRHRTFWKTKVFGLEGTAEHDHDWVVTGRPQSRRPAPALVNPNPMQPVQTRRYTVQPYSSITNIQSADDEDLTRHRSAFRHTLQASGYRQSRFPLESNPSMTLDTRPEVIVSLSSSPGPMSARSISTAPHSPSNESADGSVIPLQPTQISIAAPQPSTRLQPQAESYAQIQRMTHQRGVQDFRNRRMSEILKDGRYLYDPSGGSGSSAAATFEEQSVWKAMKGSLGGILGFRRRSSKKSYEDGVKPKAFEVIRPRPPPAVDTADDASIAGGVSSFGINRFFQESGRNNEQKRSLFVANPEAMVSQTTSLRSSISGVPVIAPRLNRSASTATSVHTFSYRSQSRQNMGSSVLEHGHTNDQRGSTRNAQHTYPRNSVESNIAEALRSETTLKLHDGGILKVSKGPEKAVQYWHKESGQYVGPSAEPSAEQRKQHSTPIGTPPVLLRIPTTDGSIFDNIQIDTSNKATPSIKSRAESRPESPTESHHNTNVTATTGKMHEILNRMFSDQADDSDNISEGGESCSTFSGRVSATILALHQKREQEELEDAQSLYRPDTLEPVLEHLDSEAELKRKGSVSSRPAPRRATSISGRVRPGTLVRTFSGPTTKSASASATSLLLRCKSGSLGRPLVQTPLHSPFVLPFSGSTASLNNFSFFQNGLSSRDVLSVTKQGLADSSTQNISVPSEIDTDKETDLTGNPAALDPLGEDSATPSNESFRR